ncbi:hypothetical protein HU200_033927 [Digitaria exilis]|uniref:HTH La-type RNA-binding domain-containing protein n=1 Tax=Digitaria exilis TaxID=1010633 RepID=A0A835BLQ8_9POAL|nr:hypothetical protein HU200_033927 [Digitaria exilis]
MSPAAGGAAPAQSAAAAAVPPAIAALPEPGRGAPAAPRRDPPAQPEGADPANAAARKTAWNVPAQPPAAAAAAAGATPGGGGGIIGGDASWPALAESARACPKSASSDSLKSLSDGSGPSQQEDSTASSVAPHHPLVEVIPIPTGSNPTSTPPPNAAAAASSQRNGSATQLNPVWRGGSNGGNNGGGSHGNGSNGGRRAANSSGGDGSSGSGGDGNWNGGSLGTGSGCNSSNGNGSSNLGDNAPGGGAGVNGNESTRNAPGNSHWNNNMRGVGVSSSNGTASGDGNNRNNAGSSNHWNNSPQNSSGSSNGVGGRGGYLGRRDHERGGNFSPRNFPRVPVMPYQQQQQQAPGVYQPGPFHRPPPPHAAHFMVPQHFYVPPFPYSADVQPYPVYFPPVEQFQNMHLVRPTVQPAWVPPQDQPNLQDDIRNQIEFYFSTNNLCHDTFLRRQMNDQGWVPIELIMGFNRMRTFTGMVDTNYILDAIRGSEILEVQGNNIRRRNDWMEWLLH